MKFGKVLFIGLAIIFLALTFNLFPGDIVRKEVRVFGTFEDFVQNKPLKVYQNEAEYDSDKGIKSNQGFIKVIEEKAADGRTIGTGFLIPPAYYDKYLRLNEFGFKEAGSTKKMVATYDSLDNLFRRRALKTYKSEHCETNSYNDTILVFKHKPNLILVTYYYNQNSSHIYHSVYHMPKALLDGYLQKMVSIGAIKPNQAKQLKRQEDEHITLKFDFQNKYLDGAREQAIEDKYNRQVLTSTTSTSTLTEPTLVKSYYIHRDAQDSTTAVTDQDGKLVERVTYGIYGTPTFWDYTQDPDNPVERSRSVIGNTILFQGRRYDYETGLYYFRNRYYDPIMGRFLSTDPLGYKTSMNLYQAFNNNPVNFTDPFGLEPVKKYAGFVMDIVSVMNNSHSKVGLKKGIQAIRTLLYLGEYEIVMKGIPKVEPANTPYFNTKKGRYIYTQKSGWIDMAHFLFYAGRAYRHKVEKERDKEFMNSGVFPFMPRVSQSRTVKTAYQDPIGEAVQEGYIQEKSDLLLASHSAYSYEDLPSDKLGAIFAIKYFDPNSNLTFAEQVAKFLNNELGATAPTAAPNWNTMPNDDSQKNPPSRINKTTTPVYTQEEVQKFNQFMQWLDSLLK